MSTSTTQSRTLSIVAGIAIAGSGLYVALRHIAEPDMQIAACAIAFATGYGAYRLADLWARSKALFAVALIGIICGEAFGLAQTAERVLAVREERARTIKTENQPHAAAKARVERLKGELGKAVEAETNAAAASVPAAKSKSERKQLARNAADARQRLAAATAEARTRLAAAETELTKMEAPKAETKLAAKFNVAADIIDLGLAGLVSVGLLAFTLAFLGLGHGRPAAAPKAVRKAGKPVAIAAVLEALRKAGKPVTVQELAAALKVSENTARRHLVNLASTGKVAKTKDGRRLVFELAAVRVPLTIVKS